MSFGEPDDDDLADLKSEYEGREHVERVRTEPAIGDAEIQMQPNPGEQDVVAVNDVRDFGFQVRAVSTRWIEEPETVATAIVLRKDGD